MSIKRSLHTMTLLAAGLLASVAAQAEAWQVAKSADGITIELSEVAGSKYKAYRATAMIAASVEQLRKLQEDPAVACGWIHECQSQRVLKVQGNESWTYTRFNAPWPVTSRDSVLHVVTSEGADGSITRQLQGAPTYIPAEAGYVRVTQVEGFWKMVPKGQGMTEVTYQVHTEPGGSVPSWVANKFVVDAPFDTLHKLKAAAESR